MSKSRKSMINKAFNKLDKTGDGFITAEDLKGFVFTNIHSFVQFLFFLFLFYLLYVLLLFLS